jgi:hypothetical protein
VSEKIVPEKSNLYDVANDRVAGASSVEQLDTIQTMPSVKEFIVSLNDVLIANKLSVRDTDMVIKKHVLTFNKNVPLEENISHQNILEEWLHYFNFLAYKRRTADNKSKSQKCGETRLVFRKLSKRELTLRKKLSETSELAPPVKKYIISLNQIFRGKKISLRSIQQMIKSHVISFNRRVFHDDQICYQNVLVEWFHFLNLQAVENRKKDLGSSSSSVIARNDTDEPYKHPTKRRKMANTMISPKVKIEKKPHPDHSSCSMLQSALVEGGRSSYPDPSYASIIVEECVSEVDWDFLIEEEVCSEECHQF